jgi:ABC-type multidrug transport system ATPase subunit
VSHGGGGGGNNARVSTSSSRSSVVHVWPVELEWRGLSCSYRAAGGAKVVLERVYGAAAPGELQALMGPSGAGKSTLMDMLAQRKSTGQLEGVVLVNGAPAAPSFVRQCAYVPQFDNFVPVMTAHEVMRFYAGIILPREWTAARRAARVGEVLSEMVRAFAFFLFFCLFFKG